MSTKGKRNIRKLVLKSFDQNNSSKQTFLNGNFPKISFSNEILTRANQNNKSIKIRSQTETNMIPNNNPILLMKNNKKLNSITKTINLTNTQTDQKNEMKLTIKRENNKSETKKILQSPQITSKKISLSDIYKLPILEKDFHTLKLNSPIKKTLGNQINNNNNSSKGKKTLNPNLYSLTNEKIKEINEMKNRVSSRGLAEINNNLNINIIDYNKIFVKKNLKPVNIKFKSRISSPFVLKRPENEYKERVKNYMKDRFYCDTETKMAKKLKYTIFNHDHSLKDKIIKMRKVNGFWGGLADYCIPIFSIKKFEYIKQALRRKKKDFKITKKSEENEKIIKYDIKPSRLFTINSFVDYKHQKNLESKREFFEKYNDSLEYYMI